jgi:hypothetical protein
MGRKVTCAGHNRKLHSRMNYTKPSKAFFSNIFPKYTTKTWEIFTTVGRSLLCHPSGSRLLIQPNIIDYNYFSAYKKKLAYVMSLTQFIFPCSHFHHKSLYMYTDT